MTSMEVAVDWGWLIGGRGSMSLADVFAMSCPLEDRTARGSGFYPLLIIVFFGPSQKHGGSQATESRIFQNPTTTQLSIY